ncbi:hypothetical protein HJFPF1_13385 [Paramyrothecium foliicola]|nr:hypothetical protein HJFPF1_13385 [Paramyrothecium foliicola]
MDAPRPQKHGPPYTSARSNNSILYCGPIATAAWLIIGAVANSSDSGVIILWVSFVYFTTILTVMLDDSGTHGPAFASGMLELDIAGFRTLSTSNAMDYRLLFWILAGMQAG